MLACSGDYQIPGFVTSVVAAAAMRTLENAGIIYCSFLQYKYVSEVTVCIYYFARHFN